MEEPRVLTPEKVYEKCIKDYHGYREDKADYLREIDELIHKMISMIELACEGIAKCLLTNNSDYILSMDSVPGEAPRRVERLYWIISRHGNKAVGIDLSGKLYTIRLADDHHDVARNIGDIWFDLDNPHRPGERAMVCSLKQVKVSEMLANVIEMLRQKSYNAVEYHLLERDADEIIKKYEKALHFCQMHL